MASQTLVTQPAFAQQIQAVPSPLGTSDITGGLQRGFMIWEKPSTLYSGGGPLNDGRDVINFLFNPSTVSTDYNIGNAQLQAAMLYTVPGDSGNLLAPLQGQTVTWQLYFDRTFELLYQAPTSAANDPAVIGVQADVYQFMQFTGVLAQAGSNASQGQDAITSAGSAAAAAVPGGTVAPGTAAQISPQSTGIMMLIPSRVYFGNAFNQANSRSGGLISANSVASQLAFYGYISEWSVQYTHWTTSMVPIRAAISVNFTMLPTPPSNDPDAVATWKDIGSLQGNYVVSPVFPTPSGKAPTSLFNR